MPAIADNKYVSLTTYRADGSAVSTPVWIVDLGDGTCGFTTASSSYKVGRIDNDPRVILQPSNAKGVVTPGSEPVTGTAVVSAPEFDRVARAAKSKYGLSYTGITIVGKFMKRLGRGSGTDRAVIITVDDPAS